MLVGACFELLVVLWVSLLVLQVQKEGMLARVCSTAMTSQRNGCIRKGMDDAVTNLERVCGFERERSPAREGWNDG